MTLYELAREDVIWMINESGEPITYLTNEGTLVTTNAIVDPNAVLPQEYGYEQQLSGKVHQFTLLKSTIPTLPKRGEQLQWNQAWYQVQYLYPHDGEEVYCLAATRVKT